MTTPSSHHPTQDSMHDVAPAPADTAARDVIHNAPDPDLYLDDDAGTESPIFVRSEPRPVRILAIGGTTSARSWSLVPLEAALKRAQEAGCETVLATVYDLNLPLFHTEWKLEDYPPTLAWLLEEVRKADGLIICSPTYHGTISGAVKNVLDALIFLGWDKPPYLGGKPVGVMAYGGMTAMGVLHALTTTVRGLKGITIPTHVAVPERAVDRETASICDERINDRIDLMVSELISFSARLRVPHVAPRARRQLTTATATDIPNTVIPH
ncbi:MAG TPA: NAD(P)H-dependent oxidoreductase [Thermomicrobiales bacterium]|nr:NAD(P)H-dependent oxidoreductase [Thermomicrobiales bacterium]